MIRQNNPVRLGVGSYSVPDAARLIGTTTREIRRWMNPRSGVAGPVPGPKEQTLTFLELLELHVVALFRDREVTLGTIRKVEKTAEGRFGSLYPFAARRLESEGGAVFAASPDDGERTASTEELNRARQVFDSTVRPFLKKLEYDNDEAIRFWPMGRNERVVLDPQRKFGKPIDYETGVPTSALYAAVVAGDEPPVVARWFGVPVAAVRAAVAFETSLAP